MIDYSIAGRFEHHVHALAIIESREDPDAKGDFKDEADPHSNQAHGLLQFHAATFTEYYGRSLNFPKSVKHSRMEADISAAASFFDFWEYMGLDRCVQAHNLGAHAVFQEGKTNPEYLAKWKAAYEKICA